jgi:HK97 family phage major capsid protein
MSYLDKVIERRDAVKVEMDAILEAVAVENRTDLTEDESAKVDTLVEESRSLDSKIEKLTAQAAADTKAAEARSAYSDVVMPKGTATTKITSEARTYSSANPDVSFVKDAFTAKFSNDYAASERLARHSREEEIERRSVGTGNFAGLVIPQFLVDLAAPFARAGRPTADFATNKMLLPAAGMTLNISRMTTGTTTAVQAAENDAVSNTNADDTLLTVNVRTIAGQQDISKQAIERGTGIDQFIIQDLIRGWHTTLDNQILNGDGNAGAMVGLEGTVGTNNVVFTEAAPTVALLYPKLADAYQEVQTNVFQNPTHWVMHPRRLAFLLAGVDGSSRPLVLPALNGPMNAVATGAGQAYYGNSGYTLMGLPIIADANVRTDAGAGANEDRIYCVNANELHLWEQAGSPFALNFDATGAGSLTIKSVVYGYSAFTAGRYPGAVSIISGTGLVAPTF